MSNTGDWEGFFLNSPKTLQKIVYLGVVPESYNDCLLNSLNYCITNHIF